GTHMFSQLRSITRVFLMMSLGLALVSGTLYAQRFDGSLRGTVRDATGGVLPGAKVTAVNDASSTSVETTTSSVGTYLFPNLLVGKYTLNVEAPGFKKSSLKNVAVLANQTAEANTTLEVGDVTAE